MSIRTYRDLEVVKESYAGALGISKLTRRLPQYEQFELGKQLRRAARSVPANIVEGWAKRASVPEFKRCLQVAIGSCDEVKFWLQMTHDEGYIPEELVNTQLGRYNKIGAMLAGLWRKWRSLPRE